MSRIKGGDSVSTQWHSTLFGPTSARIHDVGGVLQMSSLDAFLVEIQQGKPEVYCGLVTAHTTPDIFSAFDQDSNH